MQDPQAQDEPAGERPLPWPLSLTTGLCMGAADSVPGVSGGTIALILGVYERFIASLAALVRLPSLIRTPAGRARLGTALRFLVPLAIGIGAALFVGTRLLVGPAEAPGLLRRADTAPLCYAFFLGLVVFSLGEPWRRIRAKDLGCVAAAGMTAAATYWAVGLEHTTRAPEDWQLLYGGALAVSVMLLPGVSGSLMLLVIGQYTAVTGALHDAQFERLLIFGAGLVLGLVLFVPLLRLLLRTRHDITLAALTGLMAGSVRSLWPWKTHYDLKDVGRGRMANVGIGDDLVLVLCACAAGALSVWALRALEARIARRP